MFSSGKWIGISGLACPSGIHHWQHLENRIAMFVWKAFPVTTFAFPLSQKKATGTQTCITGHSWSVTLLFFPSFYCLFVWILATAVFFFVNQTFMARLSGLFAVHRHKTEISAERTKVNWIINTFPGPARFIQKLWLKLWPFLSDMCGVLGGVQTERWAGDLSMQTCLSSEVSISFCPGLCSQTKVYMKWKTDLFFPKRGNVYKSCRLLFVEIAVIGDIKKKCDI